MDEATIAQYMADTFEGLDVVVASGDSFFFYNPGGDIPVDHRFPFATLVTSDFNDTFSNLNRPGIFRLNVGVSKATFQSLFGTAESSARSYDFTALDQIMPHPVYGSMYWLCVLNPSAETFENAVRPLLAEAYETAVKKRTKGDQGA